LPIQRRNEIVSQVARLAARGGFAEGVALPPDRELASALGTSRGTLRQALGLLEGWGFLEARRGSGTRLRAPASWSLAALPALVAAVAPGTPEAASLRPFAVEALALRRSFARGVPGLVAGRLAGGSLRRARRLAEEAFAARAEPARCVARDAEALRSALETAGAPAAVWLWNDLGRAPLALAGWLAGPAPVAEDYVSRQDALWDALETGDTVRAERLIGGHLARLDRGLLAAFGPGEKRLEER
jgi:DNA-binding FadR family transcriptional regulator